MAITDFELKEHGDEAREAVRVILKYLGYDTGSPGLKETPRRFIRMMEQMTGGRYLQGEQQSEEEVESILGRVFDEPSDEMVILREIPFVSMCEHHLMPFHGTADLAYLPDGGKVLGLSKLARLVDFVAADLQMQERLGRQIADALEKYLKPKGVAVIIKSVHTCMTCRGVKKPGAEMVTSVTRGMFREDARTRAEFLSLVQR